MRIKELVPGFDKQSTDYDQLIARIVSTNVASARSSDASFDERGIPQGGVWS